MGDIAQSDVDLVRQLLGEGHTPEALVERGWGDVLERIGVPVRSPGVSLANESPHVLETGKTGKTSETRPEARLWQAHELRQGEPPRWLAKNLVGRAVVTVLFGRQGIGKSLWWVLLVAHVTTGAPSTYLRLPKRDPKHVVLVITEDTWAEVRQRLLLAGADLAYVHVICEREDGSGTPTFPADMARVDEAHAKYGDDLGLVVVDAWLDTVPGVLRIKDTQDARKALAPWSEAARRTGTGVLLVVNANRVKSPDPRDMMGGSDVISQKARVAIMAAEDPDDGSLVIGSVKANGTRKPPAERYRVDVVQVRPETDDDEGTTARLAHTGTADRTMEELNQDWYREATTRDRGPSADDRAWAWLEPYLHQWGGEKDAEVTKDAARAAGHNPKRLAHLLRENEGYAGPSGKGGAWVYRLAAKSRQSFQSCQSPSNGETHWQDSAGPCSRCGTTTSRYGPGGGPLCDQCDH